MKNYSHKARQSAPTDGRDPFGTAPNGGFYTSKQNSDACGMFYQWGRKEPFTFATSSEQSGVADNQRGKYSVKIYTIDGMLIYQKENGDDNTNKQPVGGVVLSSIGATSMMETIKTPVVFYGNWSAIIDQVGHTRSLWDYYWTSHSRGTDGKYDSPINNFGWHNNYLGGYVSKRLKSIFDPCPYGFRVSSNGTYNTLNSNQIWINWSYSGGVTLSSTSNTTWFLGLGYRNNPLYNDTGSWLWYLSGTLNDSKYIYSILIGYKNSIVSNHNTRSQSYAMSVRCIEDCAPTDGRGKGTVTGYPDAFATSKQNSDASGFKYQWGRKDPFTFATSSELWGTYEERGMYPFKIYTIDGVLIYQESNGSSNKDKQPIGGVILSPTDATSMMEAIKNPNKLYGGYTVISQQGYTKDLWNYYWTSYSRGTDGGYNPVNMNWHNNYLNGYASLRSKSIYDPCPYGFNVPSNGTWNQFVLRVGWTSGSYAGGFKWSLNNVTDSWMLGLGWRNRMTSALEWVGRSGYYKTSTASSSTGGYIVDFYSTAASTTLNRNDRFRSEGHSVRCIDFARFSLL